MIVAHAAGWAIGWPVPNPFDSPPPTQVVAIPTPAPSPLHPVRTPTPPTTWVLATTVRDDHINIIAVHHSSDDDRLYVRCRPETPRLRLFVVFDEPGFLLGNEDDAIGVFVRVDDEPRIAQLWDVSISRTAVFAPPVVDLRWIRALVHAQRLTIGAYSNADNQWRHATFNLQLPDNGRHPVLRVLSICGYEA